MNKRSQFLEGWLASEQASHDVISVKRAYIDINDGNLHDGLLFSQIMYWHGANKETGKPRLTVERDGELWLVKSYTDWMAECRINEHTARKCISRIAERGLIIVNLWKYNGAPTIHLRINWSMFETKIKSICYDVSNPIDTTGQNMDLIPQVKSLTETTTETTSETTTETHSPNGGRKISTFSEIVGVIGKVYGYGDKAALTHSLSSVLAGCSKKKGWKEYNVEPPMTVEEVTTFYKEYNGNIKPQKPITLQAEVYKWRARRALAAPPIPAPYEGDDAITIPDNLFETLLKKG